MKRASLILALVLLLSAAARADEFHLKDGSTVVGTIVGYQGNSFRVKTSYGYALVDRDAIASITVSKTATAEKTMAKSSAREKAKPLASPASSANAAAKEEKGGTAKREEAAKPDRSVESKVAKADSPMKPVATKPAALPSPTARQTVNQPASQKSPAPSATTAVAPAATPVASVAPQPPAPIPVREEVQGNLYINDTYGFRMYKPPDWNVIEGARAALPGSVVAMGTSDQTTYLIVGLEPSSGNLQSHVDATNERLSNMFDGFHPLAGRQTIIAGAPAYEYQFQGMANDQQWTGTVALLDRGGNVFTLFGVTSANTDLVQIQENVISRSISSLQFATPPAK